MDTLMDSFTAFLKERVENERVQLNRCAENALRNKGEIDTPELWVHFKAFNKYADRLQERLNIKSKSA